MRERDEEIPRDLFQSARPSDGQYAWETASSPKPNIRDKRAFGNFVSLYASFSHSFAIDALAILAKKRRETVLDPYSGAGTTLAAANQSGLPSIGFDLSPFAVALAKLRFSVAPTQGAIDDIINSRCKTPNISAFSDETLSLFYAQHLELIASLFPMQGVEEQRNWLQGILKSTDGQLNSRAYVLLCAIIATNKSAKVTTGSNPVWIRKLLEGEPSVATQLEVLLKKFAEIMCSQVLRRDSYVPHVQLADARTMPIETDSIDIAIFSPPYLNRLDYFVNNYPANMVLCDLSGINSEKIRKEMIGTTKINYKDVLPYPIGDYCKNLLCQIWNHPSKASKGYYYWNYVDYIRSTYEVSQELRRVIKPGGRGAVVIQDSFYKELRVLTHQIIIESLMSQGFRCHIVRRETVKGHMGTMSPAQVKYASEKTLYEYVIQFTYD